MLDFQELKARKNGEITPQLLTENLSEAVKSGNFSRIVYVTVDEEGYIDVGYSKGSTLEALGLIEVARQELIDDMRD